MSEDTTMVLAPESREIFDGLMVVRETLAPDLTLGELQLFALVAARSGLDPFARQVYAVKRQGRMTIQTGIDGYRSIAARTGEYDGQDEPIFGPACQCGQQPQGHPEYATVRVYRKGMGRPVGATAFWHEYVPEQNPFMWRRMPHVMIAKVAEALALRKAFPWDPNSRSGIGSDIYTSEEMEQAGNPAPVGPSLVERVQERAESVDVPGVAVSVRYFAEAVQGMDPESIRQMRESMYPDAAGVANLSGEERAALLARLLEGPDGSDDPEEETDPQPVLEGVTVITAEGTTTGNLMSDDSIRVEVCGAVAPDGDLMAGAVCDRKGGHSGPHKNVEGSWPR